MALRLWQHIFVNPFEMKVLGFLIWPLRACFLVVLRQQWPRPGTGLMSLLLTGGGWSTNLGGRVKQTGSPAALIKIPVMPGKKNENKKYKWTKSLFLTAVSQKFGCLFYSPAKAGWTGLDPLRFLTGTVGTLKHSKHSNMFRLLKRTKEAAGWSDIDTVSSWRYLYP